MVSVILLMAGKGSRMGYSKNKILLPFGDEYLFEFPLKKFLSRGYEVICVISEADRDIIIPRLPAHGVKYIYGGEERSDSVYNGLRLASGDYVYIHDAARMWVSDDLLDAIEEVSDRKNAVLTYLPVKDTIKKNNHGHLETLDRSSLIAASTPQCASLELFKEVYEKAKRDGYRATDDVSLIEKYHPEIEIKLVMGSDECFKITTPMDYELAKMIWRKKQ